MKDSTATITVIHVTEGDFRLILREELSRLFPQQHRDAIERDLRGAAIADEPIPGRPRLHAVDMDRGPENPSAVAVDETAISSHGAPAAEAPTGGAGLIPPAPSDPAEGGDHA